MQLRRTGAQAGEQTAHDECQRAKPEKACRAGPGEWQNGGHRGALQKRDLAGAL